MANVGYTLMTEQAGPRDLVRWAVQAEETGFDLLVSSDHYFPWLDEQGHAKAPISGSMPPGSGTCPTVRCRSASRYQDSSRASCSRPWPT
jgi:alkanesulfonate monooxygenase SsuD/methylene tetrahydromethanopterin reductase-like flavin-dependent oxidoreductase (luciferase family)